MHAIAQPLLVNGERPPTGNAKQPVVVVVDHHELTRLALVELIASRTGMTVVAAARADLASIQPLLRQEQEASVLLFDIAQTLMSNRNRSNLLACFGQQPLTLFSYASCAYDHHIEAALHLGVRGYVLKASPLEALLTGLTEVAAGGTYFDAEVTARLIPKQTSASSVAFATRRSLLSKREWEVLALVAEGFKAKEIAKTLHISAKTVDRHKANVMEKLAIHSQMGLTRYALAESAPRH